MVETQWTTCFLEHQRNPVSLHHLILKLRAAFLPSKTKNTRKLGAILYIVARCATSFRSFLNQFIAISTNRHGYALSLSFFGEKMKICVLGAFGNAGRAVVREILQQSTAQVVAADMRPQPAAHVFPEHAQRIQTVLVDAARPETLKTALSDCKAAISCIGPFSRYGVTVARAILENGCHGVDLCNDATATSGILALDRIAKTRGLSYITGTGCSPGLTNLLAMQAASGMDRLAYAHISLALRIDAQTGPSLLEHFMSLISEDVPVFRRHTHMRVRPHTEPERVHFPHLGRLSVSQIGHPEVFTLPEHLDVEEVWVKAIVLPFWLKHPLRFVTQSGLTREEPARQTLARNLLRIHQLVNSKHKKNVAVRVDVAGWKKGVPLQVGISVANSLLYTTAVTAVASLLTILSGDVVPPGVFSPEGALPEDRILLHMAQQGLVFHREESYL